MSNEHNTPARSTDLDDCMVLSYLHLVESTDGEGDMDELDFYESICDCNRCRSYVESDAEIEARVA